MDIKYKFETELDLKGVLALRILANAHILDQKSFNDLSGFLDDNGFKSECKWLGSDAATSGAFDSHRFNKFLDRKVDEITKNHLRKTVKIGDKTYYEDELAQALANIKEVK